MTAPPETVVITGSEAFTALWQSLVEVLGTAAVATLVRRAAARGLGRAPALAELRVVKDGWDYRYELPATWATTPAADLADLAELVTHELCPLLQEFTGPIVVRRLQRLPELRDLELTVEEP